MPTIDINGNAYEYLDSTVINFVEGLIGLPCLKKAVLVEDSNFRPFYWLASLDDSTCRFIVVETKPIFPEYDPASQIGSNGSTAALDPDTVVLAVVNVSSEWTKTTVNLRAPILLNPHTRKAAQIILSNSRFELAEKLPV